MCVFGGVGGRCLLYGLFEISRCGYVSSSSHDVTTAARCHVFVVARNVMSSQDACVFVGDRFKAGDQKISSIIEQVTLY